MSKSSIVLLVSWYSSLLVLGCQPTERDNSFEDEKSPPAISQEASADSSTAERSAQRILTEAKAKITTESEDAIAAAETVLLRFPGTQSAKEARSLLPLWLHAKFFHDLRGHIQGAGVSPNSPIPPKLAEELIQILEEYPDYQNREVVEAQVVIFVLINQMSRSFNELGKQVQQLNQDDTSAHQVFPDLEGNNDAYIAQLQTAASRSRAVLDLAGKAFEDAAREVRSLHSGHKLSSNFMALSEVFVEFSELARLRREFQTMVAETDYLECVLADVIPPRNVVDRFFHKRKMKSCRPILEKGKATKIEIEDREIVAEGRLEDLWLQTELDAQDVFSQKKLGSLVESIKSFAGNN